MKINPLTLEIEREDGQARNARNLAEERMSNAMPPNTNCSAAGCGEKSENYAAPGVYYCDRHNSKFTARHR
jgi:hypothetical protein